MGTVIGLFLSIGHAISQQVSQYTFITETTFNLQLQLPTKKTRLTLYTHTVICCIQQMYKLIISLVKTN